MSSEPQLRLDGAHNWYPVVEQVRICDTWLSAIEHHLRLLHEELGIDEENEDLLQCEDVRDRFRMWCASFDVEGKSFDRSLRKSVGIAGVVFRLFDGILDLVSACRGFSHPCHQDFGLLTCDMWHRTAKQTLSSTLSPFDKYNRLGQHVAQLRHLVEKLIELSPALEAPTLSTASQPENDASTYTLADFDLAQHPLSQSITGRFEELRDYKTLFLISNSVALRGWRWDMAAQLLYQSARRLPHVAGALEVRFIFSIPGQPGTTLGIEDAMKVFCRSGEYLPRGPSLETSVLDQCLSDFASKVMYSTAKPLSLLILTADGLGPKIKDMERLILENGKKMKVANAGNAQVTITFVQLGANPFITRDVRWLKAAINSDQAILGIIVCD